MTSFIDEVRQAVSRENVLNAIRVASRDTLVQSSNRIFVKGLDSNGKKIGEYSTKPIYISKKNSPRNAGIDTGKSLYFPGGYKQFKQAIGRGSKVNLRLFGRLQLDYVSSREIVEGNNVRYELKESDNATKMSAAENHFQTDITSLTREEEANFRKVFRFELLKRQR